MKARKNAGKLFILLITVFAVSLLFSCNGLWISKTSEQPENEAKGILKINFFKDSPLIARDAETSEVNTFNPEDYVDFFKVSLLSDSGEWLDGADVEVDGSFEAELPPGTYCVIVQAMNDGDTVPENSVFAADDIRALYNMNAPLFIGRTNDIAIESEKTTEVTINMVVFPYIDDAKNGMSVKDATFDWGTGKLPEMRKRDLIFSGWYTDSTCQQPVSDFPATDTADENFVFPYMLFQEGTTVEFWHLDTTDNQQAAWRQIADNFEASHPGVTINITCLENQAFKDRIAIMGAQGTVPDIFRSWGGGVMIDQAEAGLLRDITEYTKDGYISQISEGARGVYSYNGRQYGAPYSLGVVGLFYNKTVFEDAGLTEDDFSTWSKFLESCNVLKDKGYAPVSLGGAEKWAGHYWFTYLAQRLGGEKDFLDAYNGTDGGAFNTGSFLTAMEMFRDFVETEPFQEGFLDATQVDQDALVADRVAAMTLMGQWAPSSGRDNATQGYNDEWGLMQFPTIDGGAGLLTDVQGGCDGYIIGAKAPDEAIEFLKSLYEPENYRIICTQQLNACPVIPGYDDCIEPIMAEVSDAVQNAGYYQLYWDQFLPTAVGSEVCAATDGIYRGTLTPQEACDMIQASWEANR